MGAAFEPVNHSEKTLVLGTRPYSVAARCVAVILILAAALAAIAILAASDSASAQDDPGCTASDLGQLSDKSAAGLQANGRWSTQDCESQFRPGSDAHNFEFEVVSGGRVRIELTSSTADPYLYLLATDGARIADNDDGGALLNARIERELAPGKYLVEATTVGGRARGAADFALSVNFVDGCRLIAFGRTHGRRRSDRVRLLVA